MKILDDFLNSITMYKTVMYGLILLAACSLIVSFFGVISQTPVELLISSGVLISTCFAVNLVFSKIFKAPVNTESYLITALILFFVISPSITIPGIIALVSAGGIAMASKYLLAFKRRHIFNPVAIAAVLVALFGASVSWWVATPVLLPATLIISLLVVRKIKKFSLVLSFAVIAIIEMIFFAFYYGVSPISTVNQLFLSWPLLFFAGFMLTEPLTMPPTKQYQILYGAFVGFLFAFQLPLGFIELSPELALVVGNVLSYTLSSKERIMLTLKKKERISENIYNFIFKPNIKPDFEAGQYMEWTLPHENVDSRGNRRFFTIASSPTEEDVMLGVRIGDEPSSFKRALKNIEEGQTLAIGNLKGDFTLPDDKNKKLVFLAGGIGITPFRSILKYLVDKEEKRDIILIHACSDYSDFSYQNVFEKAKEKIGLRNICILSNDAKSPEGQVDYRGHFTAEILRTEIPDYKERLFYLSGSSKMVDSYKDILKEAGVKEAQIVTDYFSGY